MQDIINIEQKNKCVLNIFIIFAVVVLANDMVSTMHTY